MASEFITRVEHGKDEPYTVIFRTDDADKYKHIEDECRRMIGHEKPTVDVVSVVRCRECKYAHLTNDGDIKYCDLLAVKDEYGDCDPCFYRSGDWFCADGERRNNE